MDIKSFGKGGLIKPLARRDYRFELLATAGELPAKFELVFDGKIKNQDGSGSCVSQATSYYAEMLNFIETGVWTELSARDLYSQCRIDPMGSYIKDNMSVMQKSGIALEADAPSYDQGNPPSEDYMKRRDDITPEETEKGKDYLILKYLTWDNKNIDYYKRAIIQGNGMVAVSWGNNICWASGDIQLPSYKSQMVWKHGIYFIGYDDSKKVFKFINSWGTEWGYGGYGYLPYKYVELGYVTNPMTMVDVPNDTYVKLTSQVKNLLEQIIKMLQDKINKLLGK